MKNDHLDTLLDTLSAGEDATQAAAAVGLDEQGLKQLTLITRVLEARERRQARRARLFVAGLASAVVAGTVLFSAAPALAQVACAQTLPSPLVTFCADTPAQAGQVNGNFQQLVTWVQQKVGTVGNGNITTGTVSTTGVAATGDVSTTGRFLGTRANLSDGVIQRGGANITATSDLGLYSRVSGNYIRLVTNNAPIRFYNSEGTGGVGGTYNFSVETDGTLTSAVGEVEGTQLLPRTFCVVVPRNTTCPANWDARETKWDTEDDSNADSKDNVISWDDGNSGSVRMRFCCRG